LANEKLKTGGTRRDDLMEKIMQGNNIQQKIMKRGVHKPMMQSSKGKSIHGGTQKTKKKGSSKMRRFSVSFPELSLSSLK